MSLLPVYVPHCLPRWEKCYLLILLQKGTSFVVAWLLLPAMILDVWKTILLGLVSGVDSGWLAQRCDCRHKPVNVRRCVLST
jgi:hypothetical protein